MAVSGVGLLRCNSNMILELGPLSARLHQGGADATSHATLKGAPHDRPCAIRRQLSIYSGVEDLIHGIPCDRCGAFRGLFCTAVQEAGSGMYAPRGKEDDLETRGCRVSRGAGRRSKWIARCRAGTYVFTCRHTARLSATESESRASSDGETRGTAWIERSPQSATLCYIVLHRPLDAGFRGRDGNATSGRPQRKVMPE